MTKRFVYPTIIWGNKKCLQIQRENEDGKVWFGIEDAIKSYLDENSLDINEVEWYIEVESSKDYSIIKAKNIKDWISQFEDLGVQWENK